MKKINILLLLFTLVLTACSSNVDVYTNLSEAQANTMLEVLLKRGIHVNKVPAGDGFTIAVDESQLIQALEILKENSLPQEDFQSLGTVFAGGGMVATASEEQSRLTYAISQELSSTLSKIDGVLSARVHIVLANVDAVNNTTTEASAAVFIRHNPDSLVVNYIPKIKELTASSVADLKIDNVSVMLVPARDEVTVPVEVIKEAPSTQTLVLAVLALAVLLNGIGVAAYVIYKKKFVKENKVD